MSNSVIMKASDSSVVNGTEEMGNKRPNLQEKEDRISALPDSIIQYILSFLPSTKEAIQTGILSRRWRNQWSCVPVLIFDFQGNLTKKHVREKDYARFIDNTLLHYDCSKMKKFHLAYHFRGDSNFTSKIRFVTDRNVEKLILDCYNHKLSRDAYMLPKFIFDNASLVDLQILNCEFQLSQEINLPSLKVLKIDCRCLKDTVLIENVLSVSPSLESLEIKFLTSVNPVSIASKSLKILIIADIKITHDFEISCPNLEELSVKTKDKMDGLSLFPSKTLLNVLSESPSLYSLQILYLDLKELVIASESLKRLYVASTYVNFKTEISCPNLKELNWYGDLDIENCKLMNLPSSCCATLNFVTSRYGCDKKLARKILVELQRVKKLEVQDWFVKVLSALKMEGLSNPLLNVKCLTLYDPNFEHVLGILNALRCSPLLERLVIKLHVYLFQNIADLDLKVLDESYWISKGIVFTCLVSHLKTVKIVGLSKNYGECDVVLRFLEFLLKTARVLEKMTVILKDGGTDFHIKVSQKLFGFPRCSQHAIVELLYDQTC